MTSTAAPRPTIVVLAKSPVAGRVKTRCTPPCTPKQAAELAEASLAQTLDVVRQVDAQRHLLALDGPVGVWMPVGFDVVGQAGDGLGERLDRAFVDVGGPALLIGMDTPQVTPELLRCGLDHLAAGADAVVGLASDGGFWAVGLQRPWPGLFAAVPMSRVETGHRLLDQFAERGLEWAGLPVLTDVDDFATATDVAATIPGTHFAGTIERIIASLPRPAMALP